MYLSCFQNGVNELLAGCPDGSFKKPLYREVVAIFTVPRAL